MVEFLRPLITLLSRFASENHTAVALVAVVEAIQNPFQLASVEDACTANVVSGFEEGLPFSALVRV
ncbi:MAG: hypothetical protein Q8Q08_00015, partial [Candidatus Omnitrophota bacterium]|nr:hypothetical protein [Candidatus Omnitrophota bacterium]